MLRKPALFILASLSVPSCAAGRAPAETRTSVDAAPFLHPGWPGEGGAPVCREITRPLAFTLRDAAVLMLFDRSGSMSAAFGGGTRFSIEATILAEMLAAYEDKIRFGFQQFPARQSCQPGQVEGCCVEPPSVSITARSAGPITEAIEAAGPPDGNTPTAGTLRLARDHFRSLDDRGPDRYVLLSTDGIPSCTLDGRLSSEDVVDATGVRISSSCHDALTQIDGLRADGVTVIVLGVGTGLESDGRAGRANCLDEMAKRGGAARPDGPPFYLPGTDPPALERVLQELFGAVAQPTCVLELESAPPDPGQVAVYMDDRQVPRHKEQGWDFEPGGRAGTVRLYGEYCRRLQRFQVMTIEIRFGCPPCINREQCE